MLSTLIISSDKIKREDYALQLCKEQQIDPLDIAIIESEESLGINDVRNMQKKLFLKPLKSPQKAIIVKDAHTTTIEAQNALLKVLEEPPVNTIVILTAATENAFLPTILSRCKRIVLDTPSGDLSEEEQRIYTDMLVFLQQASISEKLKLAQDVAKEKEKAREWLEKIIKTARILLLENVTRGENISTYSSAIALFQKAHTSIKNTNIHTRLLLEYTLLNLW